MAVDETYTNRDICTQALRKLGIVAKDTSPDADDIEVAREALFRLLKEWSRMGYNMQTYATASIPAVTGSSVSLDIRPVRIHNARYKRGDIETPMFSLNRLEYDELPNKGSIGLPINYYFDRQKETAQLLVWPILSAVNGETFEVTYIREFEDPVLNDACDVSAEWYDAIVYNLAEALSDDYQIDAPKITQRAAMMKRDALNYDQEESVYFYAEA